MTTNDEALSAEGVREGIERLRWAIHPFGGHPVAQRRWVQMGYMQRSGEWLEEAGGRLDAYVAAGALSADEARQVAAVVEAFRAVKASRDDLFYDRQSAPREFLWGSAFEEDDWSELRAKARRTFGVLSEEKETLIEK